MNENARRMAVLVVAVLMLVPVVPASALVIGRDMGPAAAGHIGSSMRGAIGLFDPLVVNNTSSVDSTMWNTERNIVRGDNGTIYVVYADNGEIWFTTSTDNGKTWSTAVNISNDGGNYDSVTPAMATNGTAVYVAWADITATPADNEYVRFRRTLDGGKSWDPALGQAPDNIYSNTFRPFDPSLASNDDTNVYIVYMRNEGGGGTPDDVIYFERSTDSGATWSTGQTRLSQGQENAMRPTVEADGTTVVVAFSEIDWSGDQEMRVRASTNGGQGFGTMDTISNNNIDDVNPTIAINGANVTVMWQENGANTDVVFRNSTNHGADWSPDWWTAPYSLRSTSANERDPSLACNGRDMYVLFRTDENHTNGDIWMSKKPHGGEWSTPVGVTDNDDGNRWPSMKFDYSDGVLEWVWTNNTTAPYNVLYGHTSIPYLNWSSEVGYQTDGVSPNQGVTGTLFDYKVIYTDAENEGPMSGYPTIMVDMDMNGALDPATESFDLDEEDPEDTVYSDGKVYIYTAKFNALGTSRYMFVAKDTTGLDAMGEPTIEHLGPLVTAFNEPPMLDWTGEMGYGDDGLDPDAGNPLTDFEFRIRYTDIYNESPAAGFPKLLIDMNGNGTFDDPVDQRLDMVEETADDVTFENGKIYKKVVTFLPGNYSYMFTTNDLYGFSNSTPVRAGPNVGWVGARPVLSAPGGTGFETDCVDPDTGFDTTVFRFKVLFTDADNDLPMNGYPIVGVDVDRDGTIEGSEMYEMEEEDPADNVTSDGKVYTRSIVLGALGTYKYMFEAFDVNFGAADVINFTGPVVDKVNARPKLSWLGSAGYDTDGLEPELGFVNLTPFEYKVVYEDADDHAPKAGYPMVWVDLDRDGDENASEWLAMSEVDPADTVYSDGKLYVHTTVLNELGMYNYRFKAVDVMDGAATGTPTKMLNGPTVEIPPNMPPTLVWADNMTYNGTGVYPPIGDLETEFVYKVRYLDTDGNPPQSGFPKVYIDEEGDGMYTGPLDIIATMEEEDVNDTDFKDGKVYVFRTVMSVLGDNYTYMFRAMDIFGAEATVSGSIHGMLFHGPTVAINERPILIFAGTTGFDNEGVDPDKGLTGSEFMFRVVYKDVENDPPKDGKVYLMIDFDRNGLIDTNDIRKEMLEEDPADVNHSDGKEYYVTHVFNTAGTYGYLFEAQDTALNFAGGPASAYIRGPVVEVVIPNQPPVLEFTGDIFFEHDGLHPYSGKVGTKFTFRVRYIDVDNDAPINQTPTLNLDDGTPLAMKELDNLDTNYADGKIYTLDVTLDEEGAHSYSFYVRNELGQEATLGPIEGPVVVKDKTKPTEPKESQMLEDWMWLILIVVAAILCIAVGYMAGKPKAMPLPRRSDDYVEYEPRHRPKEPEPEPEPEDIYQDHGAETEPGPEPEPEPGPEMAPEEGGATEAQGPATEEETGPERTSEQEDTEALAEETETESKAGEDKEKSNIDDDLDDILKKLESG